MKEKDFQPAVEMWLKNLGYRVARECMISGYCDLIGSKWSERIGRKKPQLLETMAVELKVRDMVGVISQAKANHYQCTYSYAAMPLDFCNRMRPQSKNRFEDAGIGLIGVSERGLVKSIITGIRQDRKHHEIIRRRLWSYYLRHRND